MSQASQGGAAPVAASPPPAVAPQSPGPAGQAEVVPGSKAASLTRARRTYDTPQLLRLLTTALILVGLIFGLAGALSFSGLAYSLNGAEDNTAQLIRVQKIETNLLSADATATNSFLVGGLEPPAQRAAYDRAITSTGALIAQASEAQPADAVALSALNQAVVTYAVTIEQARANNRQGFPVGAQYLQNASSGLRTDALPILDNLVSANSTRATAAMSSHVGLFFEIIGLLGVAAMLLGTLWVARRFKRRINPGLVAATALVLIAWVVGFVVLSQLGGSVSSIKDGSFSSVNAAAGVRIDANNAKSNESLTLIARGSGASFETAWSDSALGIDQLLPGLGQTNLNTSWDAYVSTHREIRKLDDGGSWDAAVNLATGGGANSSNTLFGAFDTSVDSYLATVSSQTSQGLAATQPVLVVFAVLTFLAGVGAALLARAGLAARLREYR